ncbi:hypothetical protein H9P43_005552 [Blastocladiella emersonii ATCC 22665]|nr:hypothetical protein H9P43_005552 [Blastocladiella emersonii ATCC 22665]
MLKAGAFRERLMTWISDPASMMGRPINGFPLLQEALKGIRPGELTILTGPTGTGKTTWLSQLTLDLAKAGMSTLWGSFEIPNDVLVKKMLSQHTGQPFDGMDTTTVAQHLNYLGELPLYFMPYFGSTSMSAILDCMDAHVREARVEHIILDNLQFFLSGQADSSVDKYRLQDRAIHELRHFATSRGVHVTVVVHPRKEEPGAELTVESISGSAKITQEADVVLLLQRRKPGAKGDGPETRIDVVKNRFDGTLTRVGMKFCPASLKYEETGKVEVTKARKYNKSAANTSDTIERQQPGSVSHTISVL